MLRASVNLVLYFRVLSFEYEMSFRWFNRQWAELVSRNWTIAGLQV